jgi:cysteinyl-tRNA synthetase
MTLRIHDTRTGKKGPVRAAGPRKVSLYACGTTVYDLCHIGHARKEVAWDVITRHLRASGFALRFVRNITDVDDKIINKAKEEGTSADEVARKYTREMNVDFQALGLAAPDLEPRATEHIAEVIEIIRRLEEKGLAYAVGGDVYFRGAEVRGLRQGSRARASTTSSRARASKSASRSRARWTSRCGKAPSPASRSGRALGVRAGPDGTSSAPRWRTATWASRSTSTAAAPT